MYGEKLTQALAFVINKDRKTEWDVFEKYSEKSNLVYALGKVSYDIGDVIPTLDGPKVVKKEGYKGKVRILVAIPTLQECSPLEIYQEIMRLMSYEGALSGSESYKLFSDSNFFGQLTANSTIHEDLYDKIKGAMKPDEFNMEELSSSQEAKLELSTKVKDETSKRIIH